MCREMQFQTTEILFDPPQRIVCVVRKSRSFLNGARMFLIFLPVDIGLSVCCCTAIRTGVGPFAIAYNG